MRAKIFEYNPNTGVIRWRYEDESHDDFGWPNYGRILKQEKKTCLDWFTVDDSEAYKKWKKNLNK